MIIILMLLYISVLLFVLYSVSRGRVPGWIQDRVGLMQQGDCIDFEKVITLNDTIFGRISTVNGITHPILAKNGSDCVGVQFVSLAMAGKLCIRDNHDGETSMPHH
jgi:hypothetical protein